MAVTNSSAEISFDIAAPKRTDADTWSDRCAHWRRKHDRAKPRRVRRERESRALILTGRAMSIRVEKGTLLVRDGQTFHGQKERTFRFFKGALDIPQRLVIVDGAGEITFDALDWLREQGVTFIRLNWAGEVISVASPSGYAADANKVSWQRATAGDPDSSLAFAVDLVSAKLKGCNETLRAMFPASPARDHAIAGGGATIAGFHVTPPRTISELLLIEAREALNYFRTWKGWTMSWRDKRHPVPRSWDAFEARSIENGFRRGRNNNARHPINAILNYAYGVLETRLTIQTIAEGYDPTLGILHTSARDKASFVFDLMEPERPRVDAAVLRFLYGKKFSGSDFTIRSDGVCRLNPELARRVVQVTEAALAGS